MPASDSDYGSDNDPLLDAAGDPAPQQDDIEQQFQYDTTCKESYDSLSIPCIGLSMVTGSIKFFLGLHHSKYQTFMGTMNLATAGVGYILYGAKHVHYCKPTPEELSRMAEDAEVLGDEVLEQPSPPTCKQTLSKILLCISSLTFNAASIYSHINDDEKPSTVTTILNSVAFSTGVVGTITGISAACGSFNH